MSASSYRPALCLLSLVLTATLAAGAAAAAPAPATAPAAEDPSVWRDGAWEPLETAPAPGRGDTAAFRRSQT